MLNQTINLEFEGSRKAIELAFGFRRSGQGSRNWLKGHRIYKTGKLRRVRPAHKTFEGSEDFARGFKVGVES